MTITETKAPPMLGGIDHLEWWVGNARAIAGFLMLAFGFTSSPTPAPRPGRRDRASYVLEQGDIRFVVTGALDPDSTRRRARPPARRRRARPRLAWSTTPTPRSTRPSARGADRRASAGPTTSTATGNGTIRSPRSRRTARRCTPSSTGPRYDGAVRARLHRRRPAARAGRPARRPRPASTTSSATSSRAGSTSGSRFYEDVLGFGQLRALRRRPDLDRVLGADVDGRVERLQDLSCRSTSPPTASRRARSRSTSSPTTARACSTSRCAPTTSSPPSRALRTRACASSRCPPSLLRRRRGAASAGFDLPWDDARAARHPGRPRPRRLPAADLHRDGHRPPDACSSRSSSAEGATGFGEGNFKALFEAIEREQARRGNL